MLSATATARGAPQPTARSSTDCSPSMSIGGGVEPARAAPRSHACCASALAAPAWRASGAADAAMSQQSGKIRTITCRMSGPCAPQQQGAPPGAERSPTSPLPDCAAARRTAAPRTRQPSRSTRARRGSTVRRGSGARTEPRGNVLAKLGLLARNLSAKRLQRFDHEGLQLRRHGHPPLPQHPAMPGPPTPVPLRTRARPDAAGFERLGAPAALPRPSLAARPRASHERARAARR